MALRVLTKRELLAAHVVELLLDLGLLFQRRELQLGVREDGEQLSLDDLGAVLDQLLLDLPALDRVEIDGDERGDSGTKGKEVLEYTPLDRRDRQPVACNRRRIAPWREQPEDEDDQQERRRAAGNQDPRVDALALDDAVHRAAADGLRARRAAQLDEDSLSASEQFLSGNGRREMPLSDPAQPSAMPTLKPLVMP